MKENFKESYNEFYFSKDTDFSNTIYSHLYFSSLGCYSEVSKHFVKRPKPLKYEILLCVAGEGFVETEKTKQKITTGDIFFSFKGIPIIYGSTHQNPWTCYWVQFDGKDTENFLRDYNIDSQNYIFNIRSYFSLTDIFDNLIFKSKTASNDINNYYCQGLFYQLLFETFSLISTDEHFNPNVIKAIHYVNDNLNMKTSLNIIANHLQISKSHLSRIFHSQVGMSLTKYITQQKINFSKNLLKQTTYNISEISQLVGFENPLFFSNTFKSLVNMSPSEYRKKH